MKFSKMHALGNDFVIINNTQKNIQISSKIIKKLSDRNCGIGFDQFLIVEKSNILNCDFNYRIFNSDGSEVEQCGNGARCFAIFLKLQKLTFKNNIKVHTKKRIIFLRIKKNKLVTVNMGKPNFNPINIPFITNKNENIKNFYNINNILFSVVSIGNPHCIIQVKNLKNYEINKIGNFISNHEQFPNKINVSFMEKIDETNINIRVFERGVGETKACGTAACAAVAIGKKIGILKSNHISVHLLGGKLNIYCKGYKSSIFMTGPATHVYDGIINIKNFIHN